MVEMKLDVLMFVTLMSEQNCHRIVLQNAIDQTVHVLTCTISVNVGAASLLVNCVIHTVTVMMQVMRVSLYVLVPTAC